MYCAGGRLGLSWAFLARSGSQKLLGSCACDGGRHCLGLSSMILAGHGGRPILRCAMLIRSARATLVGPQCPGFLGLLCFRAKAFESRHFTLDGGVSSHALCSRVMSTLFLH